MARGHQNLIWTRNRQTNALRSALREYYPAALEAFDDLADRDCLAVLAKAPTPAAGAALTLGQIQAALKRGGRQRNIERRASEIQTALRAGQLAAPAAVADAFAATTRAAVAIISELNRQISQLEATLTTSFEQHPDSDIYHSLPGFGVVLGARALGESAAGATGPVDAGSTAAGAVVAGSVVAGSRRSPVRWAPWRSVPGPAWRAAMMPVTTL